SARGVLTADETVVHTASLSGSFSTFGRRGAGLRAGAWVGVCLEARDEAGYVALSAAGARTGHGDVLAGNLGKAEDRRWRLPVSTSREGFRTAGTYNRLLLIRFKVLARLLH